jgi:hypothetical protein
MTVVHLSSSLNDPARIHHEASRTLLFFLLGIKAAASVQAFR